VVDWVADTADFADGCGCGGGGERGGEGEGDEEEGGGEEGEHCGGGGGVWVGMVRNVWNGNWAVVVFYMGSYALWWFLEVI
jgi:hypothetical protein